MSQPLTAEELARLDQAAAEAGIAAADEEGEGSRWLIRPHLGISWSPGEDGTLVWLGGEVGRATWSLHHAVALAAMGSLSADFPVGPDTHGRDLRLGALVGPRFGRVSLQLGPAVGEHELHWAGGDLAPSWMVAGQAALSIDIGLVSAWIGHTAWSAADGARAPADGWPGLGDEPEWAGGAAIRLGALQLRSELSHRDTAVAPLWRADFGVRIQP
jgi:hypothetical protein